MYLVFLASSNTCWMPSALMLLEKVVFWLCLVCTMHGPPSWPLLGIDKTQGSISVGFFTLHGRDSCPIPTGASVIIHELVCTY